MSEETKDDTEKLTQVFLRGGGLLFVKGTQEEIIDRLRNGDGVIFIGELTEFVQLEAMVPGNHHRFRTIYVNLPNLLCIGPDFSPHAIPGEAADDMVSIGMNPNPSTGEILL